MGSVVAGEFTPVPPLEVPRIIASATRYPGGNLAVENMIDGAIVCSAEFRPIP